MYRLTSIKNGKLLIICGPTATGKTALGLKLSKKFGGEIVNADSRQVYIGMDIGTGKDVKNTKFLITNYQSNAKMQKNLKEKVQIGSYPVGNVPIWLLDIVRPNQEFSVALYRLLARRVIKDIRKRGKLPIVVGGSGLYIKSLIEPIRTIGIPPDWELRKKLSNLEINKLREELRKVDSHRLAKMNESDRNNPRRLMRAIEIASKTQNSNINPPAGGQSYSLKFKTKDILMIGLKMNSFTELYKLIDKRVEKRIKAGAEREVKDLLKHYSWQNSVLGATIGYKEWRDYLAGKATPDEVKKHWQFAEHGYARRQMTWFRKQRGISWLEIDKKSFDREAVNIVQQWYGKN